ncbi:MAG: hypothetical protein JWN50_149 [Parcubacteria group bacterium]|nr:hypothetical protein [Parcubacteria group bacterium]
MRFCILLVSLLVALPLHAQNPNRTLFVQGRVISTRVATGLFTLSLSEPLPSSNCFRQGEKTKGTSRYECSDSSALSKKILDIFLTKRMQETDVDQWIVYVVVMRSYRPFLEVSSENLPAVLERLPEILATIERETGLRLQYLPPMQGAKVDPF